jgi:septum formation protein
MEKSLISYEVSPADIDESVYDDLRVDERVVALAKDKCRLVAERYPDRIVIAADTLTAHEDGTVFTKPQPGSDPLDAAMQLSGQTIGVYTGCCVYSPKNGYNDTLAQATITYQEFTRSRLETLAQDDNPQIRSGALGVFVDAPGFTLIKEVQGSYTGMYGLPMEFVYEQIALAE